MGSWIWGALGVALLVVEIVAPGYFLIFPAAGALLTGMAGFSGVSTLEPQLLTFAVSSGVLFAASFRPYRQLRHHQPQHLVNSPDRLVGALARVEETMVDGRGKVRLGDTVWLARGPDLAVGEPVKVTAVAGTVLVVEAVG